VIYLNRYFNMFHLLLFYPISDGVSHGHDQHAFQEQLLDSKQSVFGKYCNSYDVDG
jgi:hypothetical protein